MKTFLLKGKQPIIKFSMLPDNTFFEGTIPDGYSLAICPSNERQIVVDVDKREGGKNGFNSIPKNILKELEKTFNYPTKSGGKHFFLNYTGLELLKNTSTLEGIDLRIGKNKKTGNNGGYVRYNHPEDIRNCLHFINNTSLELNKWLELLFT